MGLTDSSSPSHRVSDASGELEITDVGTYPLKRELLDTNVSDLVLLCVESSEG